MVNSVCSITRKGHSEFITLGKNVMEAMGWRRGDKLIAVRWENTLVLSKLELSDVTDMVAGKMTRRSHEKKQTVIDGPWLRKRGRNIEEPHGG
jgi:bifunctional DNA-binding transcriptional regulator/antitoxin component of YhaV-PrlF toxin-antitoxin module